MTGYAGNRSLKNHKCVDSQRAHTASNVDSVCRTAWSVICHTFGKRHHPDSVQFVFERGSFYWTLNVDQHHTELKASVTGGK